MLRLVHAQTVLGAILVDDIDDGLPNKNIHRLGSTGDPNAYLRDGYANKPKQACYIPRTKPTDATIPGYVDLEQSRRVDHSAGSGKIAGFQRAGLITVVSFVEADLAQPSVTGASLNTPAAGDTTIAGTSFLSVTPDATSVRLFGAGVGDVTLTQAQFTAVAPGAITDIQIVIDSTLIAGLASGDSIIVTADDRVSNTFVIP
jgi:hypothetical protein